MAESQASYEQPPLSIAEIKKEGKWKWHDNQ